MSGIRTFEHRFTVDAPLERVAQFHSDTRALKILNPPPVFVQFHKVEPLGEGSVADFTLWLGPLPIHWVAVHSDFHPSRGFVDTQQSGPFDYWQHQHTFTALSDHQTEVIDVVQARFSSHPFWAIVTRLMWINLKFMFAYRAWQTRRHTEQADSTQDRITV